MAVRVSSMLCLVAAACAYQPGSFDYAVHQFPGARVTVGCFDLAIERRADVALGSALSPVLSYDFANRCDHPQLVDLAAVTVIARGSDGRATPLAPYDPRHELHPVALDGRTCGTEVLAYPVAAVDRTSSVTEICVDVAPLARASAPVWRCFAQPGAPRAPAPVAPAVRPDALIVGASR